METSSKGALRSVLNDSMPAQPPEDSIYHVLIHAGGRHVHKTHTLDGTGAQADNLFQITGVVRVLDISMYVDTVTDATTLTGVKFELDDGTTQTDITATVDGSSTVAGSFFYKSAAAATALTHLKADQARFSEPASDKKAFQPFIIVQKAATNTYIRIAFTGDASTDVDVTFHLHYEPVSDNGLLVAV